MIRLYAKILFMISLPLTSLSAGEITVTPSEVLRTGARGVVGINLNYLRDSDANRAPGARKLTDALEEMKPGCLRYPGGEKSDFSFWAVPPFNKPAPVAFGSYKDIPGKRMDFDQYMKLASSLKSKTYLVVGYDSEARSSTPKERYLQNAESLLRYAKKKRYRIDYCEIGNENWHNNTATPEQMAAVAIEFSKAIKAIDPEIHVGASGNSAEWWKRFLPAAAPHLDFICISLYNAWGWKSYDHYAGGVRKLTATADEALAAINALAEPDKQRLHLVVSETNSIDYSPGGWKDENSIGHALVSCDTLGQLLLAPKVSAAMVWGTRWLEDAKADESLFFGLGPKNEICCAGMPCFVWGNYCLDDMIQCKSSDADLVCYATRTTDETKINLIIIKKSDAGSRQPVTIRITSDKQYEVTAFSSWSGNGASDPRPKWQRNKTTMTIAGNAVSPITLPAVSLSVLSLRMK